MNIVIFGAGGQDGHYLTRHLLELEHKVFAVIRRSSVNNAFKLADYVGHPNFRVMQGDVTDYSSVQNIIRKCKPAQIYNLASQSSVGVSFGQPIYTFQSITTGCLNILESIRDINKSCKYYQASSSEMFGSGYSVRKSRGFKVDKYQNEESPMRPLSPYGIAKLSAHNLVRMYRDSYKMYACSGILYNHESPMRGEAFVTRKITKWIGEFSAWAEDRMDSSNFKIRLDDPDTIFCSTYDKVGFPKLRLGDLDIKRDWGHAEDYVNAMYMMMQYSRPDDYIVSTQESHSIQEFANEAFNCIGIIDSSNYIAIDKEFYRPSDIEHVTGDSSKIRTVLGWKPKYNFEQIVREMVEADLKDAKKKRRQATQRRSIV